MSSRRGRSAAGRGRGAPPPPPRQSFVPASANVRQDVPPPPKPPLQQYVKSENISPQQQKGPPPQQQQRGPPPQQMMPPPPMKQEPVATPPNPIPGGQGEGDVQMNVSNVLEVAKAKAQAEIKAGSKRKAEDKMDVDSDSDNLSGKPRPKKKRKSQGSAVPKNALMQLNEIKPGLKFEFVSQSGPSHSPQFTVKVNVNGMDFEGVGTSKQGAKSAAAEQALKSFVQFKNASAVQAAMGRQVQNSDFTIDSDDMNEVVMSNMSGQKRSNGTGKTRKEPVQKNALMILNEMRTGLKFELVKEMGVNQDKKFVMSVIVDDKKYEGIGRSKKGAKHSAAAEALQQAFGIDCASGNGSAQVEAEDGSSIPRSLADHINKLVITKFTELTDRDGANYARRKVLAGFIVTRGDENAQVVSLATGTKCINGEYISDQGLALNDCHAEIIARRSFKRYLYGQLALLLGSAAEKESSIFMPKPTGGYKLKDDVQVHLFISTSPCGDARIFSPHETPAADDSSDKHPNRKARGQLRTKIESGEGTIPVKGPSVQTWDGVLQGERLLTMSCSDKLCKWNTLGLQGALLSHLVEPIYLTSVVLGSLYHGEHMSRAMYGRVAGMPELPGLFRLNKPSLSGVTNPERRQPGKAPGFSVNWTLGDNHLEIINCTTGKDETNLPSQVCKQALYRLFQALYSTLRPTTTLPADGRPRTYQDMKDMVADYQKAKQCLYARFVDMQLGAWVGKPQEQDAFSLSQWPASEPSLWRGPS